MWYRGSPYASVTTTSVMTSGATSGHWKVLTRRSSTLPYAASGATSQNEATQAQTGQAALPPQDAAMPNRLRGTEEAHRAAVPSQDRRR